MTDCKGGVQTRPTPNGGESAIIFVMEGFTALGKLLVITGVILVLVGLFLWGKIPFLGRLPGDILIKRDGFVIYIPITSMLLISAILTLIGFLFHRK